MAEATAAEVRPRTAPVVTVRPLAVKAPEAARLIGISRATFTRMLASGRFGPTALRFSGRAHVYIVAEIDAWLRAGAPPRDRWEWISHESSPVHGDTP